jgi:thiol-disulfide isomerase/thioredoxin
MSCATAAIVAALAVLLIPLSSVRSGTDGDPIVATPGPGGAKAMAPNLAAARAGVLLTWVEPADGGRHRLRLARSTGSGWSAPVTIAESADLLASWADIPSSSEREDGTLIAHWGERVGDDMHASHVVVGRSTDGGRTWARLGPVHDDRTATEHGFVSLLPDAGATQAIWLDGRQMAGAQGDGHRGAMNLRAAAIGDGITASTVLDDRICDCCGTAAAITSKGPVVVYRDRSSTEVRDIYIARRIGGRWRPGRPVHRDGWKVPGCPVNGPAIAARGDDVVVAWYTYAASRSKVLVAFSRDAGSSFSPPVEVDADRGRLAPIGRVDVVLLAGNEAAVTWMVSERDHGRILVRRVSRDGRLGRPLTVAMGRADREAGFPRMEPAGSDLVLAWTGDGGQAGIQTARLPVGRLAAVQRAAAPKTVAPPPPAPVLAPDAVVETLDGTPASLEQLRGRPVLVNFWATWCEPCRMEIPELVAIDAKFRARGLQVVAVSVDRDGTRDQIRAFLTRRKATFHQWLDRKEALAGAMAVSVLPATFLVDRSGKVLWRATGAITAEDRVLRRHLERALAARGS